MNVNVQFFVMNVKEKSGALMVFVIIRGWKIAKHLSDL